MIGYNVQSILQHTAISIIDYPSGKSQAGITRAGRDRCALAWY